MNGSMDGVDVFEALAESYYALCVAIGPAKGVSGRSHGLRFGSLGGGIPDINRLMPTRTAHETADADLDAALEQLRGSPVLSAWIPLEPSPADIADRFLARGFRPNPGDRPEPAMAADLRNLPSQLPLPGVEILRVASRRDVDTANRVLAEGFEAPPEVGTFLADLTADAVLDAGGSVRTFLATLGGRPVATALASVHAGVVGIYSVATVPEARGRGLGRAVTLAAMDEGASRGATVAVLEASEMGRPVYERLGFEETGRYRILIRNTEDAMSAVRPGHVEGRAIGR